MAFLNNWGASRFLNKGIRASRFLDEMDKIIPRETLVDMIEEKIPTKNFSLGGRPRISTETKLRMYFLSQWFNLSDVLTEEGIYDRLSFQKYMNIDVSSDQIPDSTTLCDFRLFLEKNNLGESILSVINKVLEDANIILEEGTLIDATIITAPSSTKNKDNKRDPEMSSTRKRGTWFFGGKVHISTDTNGLIRAIDVTTAKVHDSKVYESLVSESTVYTIGDAGYSGKPLQERAQKIGVKHIAMKKRKRGQKRLSIGDRLWNTLISMPRKIVEFSFGVIKHLWGHRKTRYRGLKKMKTQWNVLSALCNIYRARGRILKLRFG